MRIYMFNFFLFTLTMLCVSSEVLQAQQSSLGAVFGADFAKRTVRPQNFGDEVKEEIAGATGFVLRPSVGIAFERDVNPIFSLAAQIRYQTAGFYYDYRESRRDPLLGTSAGSLINESTFLYEFIAIPLGATETFGNGRWQFYGEEFIIPMFTISAKEKLTYNSSNTANVPRPDDRDIEDVRDVHLSLRLGAGVQHALNDILRLRVGISGYYNVTLTQEDRSVIEHLYGFGPEVSLMRVFGTARKTKANDTYY